MLDSNKYKLKNTFILIKEKKLNMLKAMSVIPKKS